MAALLVEAQAPTPPTKASVHDPTERARMSAAERLRDLPDDALRGKQILVDAAEYIALYREARGEGPMFVDSAWLVTRYGFTQDWWAERARAGDVEAFQDAPGSPWRFDRAACLAHLLRLKNNAPRNRVKRRGPWEGRRSA